MRGFSRLWLCRVAKFNPQSSAAVTIGIVPSLLPSMPSALQGREDPKLELAAEMLCRHGSVQFRAWGTSMLPSVWPGDMLTIQSATQDEVVPQDIVLVQRDQRFIVHRLIERREVRSATLLITRGDAMPHSDPPAGASELLGRVVRIRRGNRDFIPSRRLSLTHSALAWALCRSGRFGSLTFRIWRTISLRTGRTRIGQFFRSVFGPAVRGVRGVPSSRTSQP
jgi:hypothetical protein